MGAAPRRAPSEAINPKPERPPVWLHPDLRRSLALVFEDPQERKTDEEPA